MTVQIQRRRRSSRATAAGLRPCPLATLALCLALGACSNPSGNGEDATEAPPDPRATAEALGITIDTEQMTEFRCHAMGETIMGDCSDEDLIRLTGEVLARRERTAATAEAAEAGSGPSDTDATGNPDPVTRVGASNAPGIDPKLLAELADDGITVDLGAMADLPCHAMFDIVMGDCSEADIRQVAAELRSRRGDATPVERPSQASFVPGQGLIDPEAAARQPSLALDLEDGARIEMDARPVRWQVGETTLSGYAYNGTIPGPLLRVHEGDQITVHFRNAIDMPTTVHWHGLRHDNADDGVPGVTQPAILPGGEHTYTLRFPDPGVFWYHPHVREDIQQDAGMYGVIVVEPADSRYYLPVDHEEVLILDDLLLEADDNVAYGNTHANFAIMGRFGNRLLINGDPDYRLTVAPGEVVRFHLANVANVRPFRLAFEDAKMRLVGSDLSRYEVETFVDEVLIAPAERYTVDVRFDTPGEHRLVHRSKDRDYSLGTVTARGSSRAGGAVATAFGFSRYNSAVTRDIAQFAADFDRAPDIVLELDVDVPGLVTRAEDADASGSGSDPGATTSDAEHADEAEGAVGHADDEAEHASIEYEDDMLAANRQSFGGRDVRWIIRDRDSGAENGQLAYVFRVGDIVKIRIVNDPSSQHPMQHPIHIHGQRFVAIAVDDEPVANRVWKDTVLVPIGSTVDLLMEVTNPGAWMVHCHIAEHLESGMMFQFSVVD